MISAGSVAAAGSPPAKQARTVASTQAPSGGAVRRVQLVDTEVMGRISLTPAAEGIKVSSGLAALAHARVLDTSTCCPGKYQCQASVLQMMHRKVR